MLFITVNITDMLFITVNITDMLFITVNITDMLFMTDSMNSKTMIHFDYCETVDSRDLI